MKFFHLSDLHIGLKLKNRDLSEDQRYIFRQIIAAAKKEQPDAVLIAGDIYDKAMPAGEAVSLFDEFITGLREAAPSAHIMAISGNHDSGQRVNVFRHILTGQNIHMIGLPPERAADFIEKVTLTDEYGPAHFYLLPFVRPSMVREVLAVPEGESLSYAETLRRLIERESINVAQRNVLVSHQFYLPQGERPEDIERSDSEIITLGNIDMVEAEALCVFDYAALGHIHKPMKVGGENYRYSGTPLFTSVSEAGQEKGILSVTLGAKGEVAVKKIPLTPLRRVRVITGLLQEVLAEAGEDYVSVIITDPEDLDTIDMQDRLRRAFPRLLEVRREGRRQTVYEEAVGEKAPLLTPLELIREFLPDLNEAENQVLQDVINTVQEGK